MTRRQVIRKKVKDVADPIAKQKTIWTLGHLLTLSCSVLYLVYRVYSIVTLYQYRSWRTLFLLNSRKMISFGFWRWVLHRLPRGLYSLALVGVLLSHGVSASQNWAQLGPSVYDLLSTDNFQNLLIAAMWLFSRRSIFKLFPFMITSYLHLTKKKNASEKETTQQNRSLLHLIAYSEVAVLVSLVFDTLLLRGFSGFYLVFYFAIFLLKVNFSPYMQGTLLLLLGKLDRLLPASQQQKWAEVKKFLLSRLRRSGAKGDVKSQ